MHILRMYVYSPTCVCRGRFTAPGPASMLTGTKSTPESKRLIVPLLKAMCGSRLYYYTLQIVPLPDSRLIAMTYLRSVGCMCVCVLT